MSKKDIKEKTEEKLSYEKVLSDLVTEMPVDKIKMNKSEISTEKKSTRGSVGYIDIHKELEDCKGQANDFIDYMVTFYLSDAILNDPYIKKRMDDDKDTIADLLFQMKTSQFAISKLIEVIDEGGAMIPRNFEVLSMLQKSKMEIIKHYEGIKIQIEKNYKDIKVDWMNKTPESNDISLVAGYGQRQLLQKINENIPDSELDYRNGDDIRRKNAQDITENSLPPGVSMYFDTD